MNVYDFDNTIYDGESVKDYFFWQLKKDKTLLKYVPKVIYAFFKYKQGKVTVDQALEQYGPLVEKIFSGIDDLRADAVVFWDEHIKNIKPFYAELHRDDDVIVTASPEFSMDEVCKRLNISHCVGTVVNTDTGKIERLCMRSKKVPAFLEAFPNAHIDNFYTDSPKNDKPLIDLADHAFVVTGDKIEQIK